MKRSDYHTVRDQMRIGDVLAFSGCGLVSKIISWKTRSPVTHVGVVLRNAQGRVKIIESTTLTGKRGVQTALLSERLKSYKGEVWWLRLRRDLRLKLDTRKMYEWLLQQNGKPYPYWEACASALLWWNREDFKALFCSELVAGALEAGGIWSGNASEMTPADVVGLEIYERVEQIHGERKVIF